MLQVCAVVFSKNVVQSLLALSQLVIGTILIVSEDTAVEHSLAKRIVHIVGKAAIADYLWLHILEGNVFSRSNGFFRTGTLETSGITFQFLSGPGYIQTTIPQDIEYLVIVLNGR